MLCWNSLDAALYPGELLKGAGAGFTFERGNGAFTGLCSSSDIHVFVIGAHDDSDRAFEPDGGGDAAFAAPAGY